MASYGARPFLRFGLALLLSVLPAAAAAQQATFVDPVLRLLGRPGAGDMIAGAARAQAAGVPIGESFTLEVAGVAVTGSADAPRLGIFVQVRGPAGVSALRAAGADVGTVVGDIVSATLPISALPSLFDQPDLAVIQAARVTRPVTDSSMRAINAHVLRQVNASGVWTGFAGQGVLVGIVDSGIDYTHGDFRQPDGSTRIAGIWDMTLSGVPPAGFSYGILCDPASINSGACPQRDTFGHGTHVAGIAAGDGSGGTSNPFRYAGVAPLANLLVAKGGNGSIAQNRIVDGIDWVFREAARLSRPAVVNLSLGNQFGPHDGTLLYEQAIDQLSGSGRIVVISAGNDGDNNNVTPPGAAPAYIHAHALVAAGPQEFVFSIPTYTAQAGACNDVAFLDFWHEPQDRLSITVVRPDGTSATAEFGQLTFNDSPAGQIAIDNVSDMAPYPGNGDFNPFVRIGDCDSSGPAAAGNWTVRVTPTASGSGMAYHFWLANSNFGGQPASGSTGFNNAFAVSSPGVARRAITVGAFVSRVCFPSQTGQTLCLVQQEEVGDLAIFSGSGPTRDGRLKPEITAPGRLIISSLSAQSTAPNNLITADGAHVVNQGTSMAAPHVAGAVALLLQADPTLTPETIKDVLAQSARQDGFSVHPFTGEADAAPNNSWGHGKLDAQAALEAIGGINIVATVTIAAAALPIAPSSSRAGARSPLLDLQLSSEGIGPARIDQLGFEISGNDPGARVIVVRDLDNDGQIDQGEPVIGSAPVSLAPGDPEQVSVPTDLVINPGETVHLLAGVEFSGAVPHNTGFQISYVPSSTSASAVSGTGIVVLEQPSANVASAVSRSTVLGDDEFVSFSENPVRSERLILNFRVRPDRAAIYTTAGRRVRDLLSGTTGVRIEWNLTNDDGTRVAPGVYLLVVETTAGSLQERLMVLTPASSSP